MKKLVLKIRSALVIMAALFITQSCGGNKSDKVTPNPSEVSVTSEIPSNLPNYRYVDADTILAKYNLAKDYNEEMTRMQDNIQSQIKKHQNSLQSLGNTIQNKMQNNTYMTEASYKADVEKYNNLELNAQNEVAKLQQQYESAFVASNKAVIDSIEAFVKIYNEKKGYDAIFMKSSTLYINPALDITDEIIEGLNARYNKVK